jgi:glutathione S-transferase
VSGPDPDSSRSDTISGGDLPPRRRLLEEILEARSRVVARLEPLDDDPPASSWQWPVGLARLAARARARQSLAGKRATALDCAVVSLAWLERIDEDLRAQRGAGSG